MLKATSPEARNELQFDFALQFRTFGEDVNEVAQEFNAFCEGKHPLY
jgi:hypothetical protein